MEFTKSQQLDSLDLEILSILIKDSRTPFLEIARQCHVSGGTIHVRIKKMEEMNIIKGSKLIIDTAKIGFDICCFIGINLEKASFLSQVAESLEKIPEIVELYYTTGDYSIFLKVICQNISHLQKLLADKLQIIEGVQSTSTVICLLQKLDRNIQLNELY
ncbi:Lrp/AsnC family transcriptional regulator for asnA, asnC and gidA [Clostridium tetanomorphum]|uniref:Winged helix-turn-helix transcriptional regulator n=1 Tax=Clostridium tetanomorphum TaxID=1553 RepID=A0A923ECI5_CLOTT|nr:Lrp/AsnC ligand binding domain-containing protein [Clostridium tetanomorphum]KAJ50309.1 regulatory protein asnC [Clostridium tetanomorphum DSM 665]MBC2397970.1 winged helix-turn-helix transcriptional regulator [Clostridium tetanomorphum]MBP1864524.1 Lrp/AsnC family transcriptional regulator for asnA, asnC and gidA [Clostridium tetanomorphum]NRS82944.1 Lrp/AsnC family transcriptional regulator for asnA, asnC and gidA [Clostridium tetanomorphum]NRZ98959.1 Lrp/AsnC family transcriptional regul